jgi:hypothetical protein
MTYDVKFQEMIRISDDGKAIPATVGVGQDGTVWLDPDEVGISARDVIKMTTCSKARPVTLLDYKQGRAFINAQALADTQDDPVIQQSMRTAIAMILEKIKERKSLDDNLRNN